MKTADFRKMWDVPAGGFDLAFAGEPIGWARELPEASHYEPGVVAVGPDGERWVARGGNAVDGAQSWERVMSYEAVKPAGQWEALGLRWWNNLPASAQRETLKEATWILGRRASPADAWLCFGMAPDGAS